MKEYSKRFYSTNQKAPKPRKSFESKELFELKQASFPVTMTGNPRLTGYHSAARD
jgi:hypothetical protein